MKLTLKLNEEQQGLKLIQVNDGFVVVDCSKECYDNPKVWNYSTNTGFIFQGYRRSYGPDYDQSFAILFATPNLNLEGVPEIEEKSILIDLLNEQKISCSNISFGENPKRCFGFVERDAIKNTPYPENYKQIQQNLFTEEQVREALKMKDTFDKDGYTKFIPTDNQIIQSLKQPTVEITFENNKPIKCVML